MLQSTSMKSFWTVAALAGWMLAAFAGGALGGSAVTEGSKAAELQQCVEPTSDMRRNHMKYIQHERDLTVHLGIRGRKHSLAGCVECHAATGEGGAWKAVNAEDQFCESCHEFAAVSVDCFDCHRNTPQNVLPQLIPMPSVRASDAEAATESASRKLASAK